LGAPASPHGRSQKFRDEARQGSRLERLGDESDASGPHEPVRLRGARRRERHHGDAARDAVGLQRSDHRQPVHLGHVVVDEDQVGTLGAGELDPDAPRQRLDDPVAVSAEQVRERAQDERIVVDHQDGELPEPVW